MPDVGVAERPRCVFVSSLGAAKLWLMCRIDARLFMSAAQERARVGQADLLELRPDAIGADVRVHVVLSTAMSDLVSNYDRLFANLASILRHKRQLLAQCRASGNLERFVGAVCSLGKQ